MKVAATIPRLMFLTATTVWLFAAAERGMGVPPMDGTPMPRATASAPARPKLWLQRRLVDFGPVRPGSTTRASVTVRNDGAAELVVTQAETGCECLAARLEPMRLATGQSGVLSIELRTAGRRGWIREAVGLVGNQSEGVTPVAVVARVEEDVYLRPERLYVLAKPGGRVTATAQVVSRAGEMALGEASLEVKGLTAKVDSSAAPDRPARVELTGAAPLVTGVIRQPLRLPARRGGLLVLPLILSVTRADVTPRSVDFGRFPQGQAVTRELTVSLPEGAKLAEVRASPAYVRAELEAAEGKAVIRLWPMKQAPLGPFSGELTIGIAGQEASRIVLPFEGYVDSPEGRPER